VPLAKSPDTRLLLALLRLAQEEFLPDNHRIARIAQTTVLTSDAESLTLKYWREAERDALDIAQLTNVHHTNVSVVLARATAAAGYLAHPVRAAAEGEHGRSISRQAWDLLVSALAQLVLRYDTDEGRVNLTARIDQISMEVATL
jgi:hypothetical protein